MLIDYKNATIYQEDKLILDNANFHLDEGEFIYLIGKVGSGKHFRRLGKRFTLV